MDTGASEGVHIGYSRARPKYVTALKKLLIKNALIFKSYAKLLKISRAFCVYIKNITATVFCVSFQK